MNTATTAVILKPGVRALIRIVLDDTNKNAKPDVGITLDGKVPGFSQFHMETPPMDIGSAEAARKALHDAALVVTGPGGDALRGLAGAVEFMVGTGQRGVMAISLGDQDADGHLDAEVELSGHLLGFPLPTLDTGARNLPIAQSLAIAKMGAAALPQPAAGIVSSLIAGVEYASRYVPV